MEAAQPESLLYVIARSEVERRALEWMLANRDLLPGLHPNQTRLSIYWPGEPVRPFVVVDGVPGFGVYYETRHDEYPDRDHVLYFDASGAFLRATVDIVLRDALGNETYATIERDLHRQTCAEMTGRCGTPDNDCAGWR